MTDTTTERDRTRTTGFLLDGSRYDFDFGACRPEKGWAQCDTEQDASYYGCWAQPWTLEIIEYAEGDVTRDQYKTPQAFCDAIRAHAARDGWKAIDPGLDPAARAQWEALGLGDLCWPARPPIAGGSGEGPDDYPNRCGAHMIESDAAGRCGYCGRPPNDPLGPRRRAKPRPPIAGGSGERCAARYEHASGGAHQCINAATVRDNIAGVDLCDAHHELWMSGEAIPGLGSRSDRLARDADAALPFVAPTDSGDETPAMHHFTVETVERLEAERRWFVTAPSADAIRTAGDGVEWEELLREHAEDLIEKSVETVTHRDDCPACEAEAVTA